MKLLQFFVQILNHYSNQTISQKCFGLKNTCFRVLPQSTQDTPDNRKQLLRLVVTAILFHCASLICQSKKKNSVKPKIFALARLGNVNKTFARKQFAFSKTKKYKINHDFSKDKSKKYESD